MAKPIKKPQLVSISLRFDVDRLKAVDAAARKKGISRSAFINIAVTNLLEKGL